MQLAHLLPHLDAEIDRLQRARDLLAFVPPSRVFIDAMEAVQVLNQPSPAVPSMVDDAATATVINTAKLLTPGKLSLERRPSAPQDELRRGRRSRMAFADTALRGSVPTGPVVVSAEDVRRSQASKTAQTTRAAEVRRAGAGLVSNFGWRTRTSDMHSVDSLLQRLLAIGEEDGDRGIGGQLSSLGRRENFEVAHGPLVSKVD